MGLGMLRAGLRERRTFQRGVRALARVVEARPTGTEINDQPELELTLDVRLDPPVRSMLRVVVPVTQIAAVGVGREIYVRIDPADPSTAPELSLTVPVMRELPVCASETAATRTRRTQYRFDMTFSSQCVASGIIPPIIDEPCSQLDPAPAATSPCRSAKSPTGRRRHRRRNAHNNSVNSALSSRQVARGK
jgi:hypothetical protein